MTQEPSYHLEGVIRTRDEMEDFTGPLDLILMLLSKNKIEIRDIQISLLLDQYLEYLRMMEQMDLEIASEFVQMASYLLYIKTKMLLNTGSSRLNSAAIAAPRYRTPCCCAAKPTMLLKIAHRTRTASARPGTGTISRPVPRPMAAHPNVLTNET